MHKNQGFHPYNESAYCGKCMCFVHKTHLYADHRGTIRCEFCKNIVRFRSRNRGLFHADLYAEIRMSTRVQG